MDQLQKVLAAMIRQGATEADLEAYTAEYEQQHRFADPTVAAPTNTGEAILPGAPRKAGVGEQLGGGLLTFTNAVNPFQDEAAGVIGAMTAAPGKQQDAYTRWRDQARGQVKGFKVDHPKMATGLGIAGALLPAVASVGASTAAKGVGLAKIPLRELMKQGAQSGATAGAVYGFGNAEGSPLQQAKQTGISTIAGGAIGGLAPAIGRGVSKATRKIGEVVGRTTEKGRADKLARTLDEQLAASGQTADDVGARANRLQEAGAENVSVAEALGPAGPRVVDRMKSGLSTVRDEAGRAPAGQAAQMASQLDESVAAAKQGLEGRTGAKTAALYDQARQVGGVNPMADPKAVRALEYFQEQFPEAEREVLGKLQRQMRDGKLSFSDIEDPRSGERTLTYWDEFKKFLDGQVRARKAAPSQEWSRSHAREAEGRLDDLVKAIDDQVHLRSGEGAYAAARSQAQGDILARKALAEQQAPLARSLEAASKRTGRASDPETSLAQFGAQRGKIGIADLLMDLMKTGIRKSEQTQAGTTLTALSRPDPAAFMHDAVARATRQRGSALKGARAFGLGAGSILSRALGGQ